MKKFIVIVLAAALAPAVLAQGNKPAATPEQELRPAKLSPAFRAAVGEAFDAAKRADARHIEGGEVFGVAHLEAGRLVDAVKRKASTDDERKVALALQSYLANVKHCAETFAKGPALEKSYKEFVRLRNGWRRDAETLLGEKAAKRGTNGQ